MPQSKKISGSQDPSSNLGAYPQAYISDSSGSSRISVRELPETSKKRTVSIVYASVNSHHDSDPKKVKLTIEESELEKAVLDFMNRVQENLGMRIEDYLDKIKSLLPPASLKEIDPNLLEQALIVCEMIADGLDAKTLDSESHTSKELIMRNITEDLEMGIQDSLRYIISFFETCQKIIEVDDQRSKKHAEDGHFGHLFIAAYSDMVDLRETVMNDPNAKIYESEDGDLVYIPPQIGRWTKLKTLSLIEHRIRYFPPQVDKMKALTRLSLKMNLMDELPKNITKFSNLKELDISENSLSDLPREMQDFKRLEILDVAINEFKIFPNVIFKMTSLKELSIGGNDIKVLPEDIGKLTNLRSLDLSTNQLTTLPESLLKLTKLKSLLIEGIDSLKWSSVLQTLSDRGCKITGVGPDGAE